jgi:hypothetical protein
VEAKDRFPFARRALVGLALLALVPANWGQLPPQPSQRIKGWIEGANELPREVRRIEPYGERSFVEVSAAALPSLLERGFRFQPVPDADQLSVGAESFDVRDGEPAIPERWRADSVRDEVRRPFLVKFEAPPKPEWLEALSGEGATPIQYQAQFGYLVLAPPSALPRLAHLDRIAFASEYHALYKADSTLRALADRDERMTVRIVYFDVPGFEQEIERLVGRGARLAHRTDAPGTSQWAVLHTAIFEGVSSRDLPDILRSPHVYWAERWLPAEPEDERSAQIIAGNLAGSVPSTGYAAWLSSQGIDGTGVTIAIADTGLDTGVLGTLHPDLAGRVQFANALCAQNRDRDGHGTNVTSIAAGDPRPPGGTGVADTGGFYWGMGVAPRASVYFQKALDSGDCGASYFAQANTLAQDAVAVGGAEVGNHSFTDGATPGASYTSQCQAWDARVRDANTGLAGNQPYGVFFSAGNSGPAAGSLTSPHGAKNIVTVGATENYMPGPCPGVSGCGGSADDPDSVISFSSRGPTSDGRIKPDVVAPGHVVAGARASLGAFSCFCDGGGGSGCCASIGVDGSNLYSIYSGTSQASPGATGAGALVYDWYLDHFGAFPSPAMAKAILINGATDLQAPNVPNNDEGWGRVNLSRSLAPGGAFTDQSVVLGTTGDATAFTATYYAQSFGEPVRAALVWTDPPGAVGCNPCLVNDLDLLLTQGATTWRGNNFTGGLSNTGATADTRNNVESVRLDGSSLGCSAFQIKVRAQTLAGDGVPGNADSTDQDFALVVSNAGATPAPPSLEVQSATLSGGCDADEFLDRQETATLAVVVRNGGCSAAAGVTVTLAVDSLPAGASASVSPATAVSLGTIAAGATANLSWQVHLDNAASSLCGQTLRLRLDASDAASRSWSDTIDLALDADGLESTFDLDQANTDRSFSKASDWSLASCRTSSPSSSWHLGQADCSGIPRDATTHDLVFAYTLDPSDALKQLAFDHAWDGYNNATLADSFEVGFDAENDGTYVTLDSWTAGASEPAQMVAEGPYDLSAFDANRASTVKVRFRFTSGANWVGGPNNAAGWDVDDIVLIYDSLACDTGSCPTCATPSGVGSVVASDALACRGTGVSLSWPVDPGAWGDSGGSRSYTVLRDGGAIASGPCAGALAYGTSSCTDTTGGVGVAHTYSVRYTNGCGSSATTPGASATDAATTPPPLSGTLQVAIASGNLTLSWPAQACGVRYDVYAGAIGSFASHAIFTAVGLDGANSCFEPLTSTTFADPGGDLYFLVSVDNGIVESSLGASSVSNPRPYASPSCSPHD